MKLNGMILVLGSLFLSNPSLAQSPGTPDRPGYFPCCVKTDTANSGQCILQAVLPQGGCPASFSVLEGYKNCPAQGADQLQSTCQ